MTNEEITVGFCWCDYGGSPCLYHEGLADGLKGAEEIQKATNKLDGVRVVLNVYSIFYTALSIALFFFPNKTNGEVSYTSPGLLMWIAGMTLFTSFCISKLQLTINTALKGKSDA